MLKLTFLLSIVLLGGAASLAADLARIDRTLVKEPVYKSTPKYCLLVFGQDVSAKAWLVQDGDTLYVDRNGNGDVSEIGEAVVAKPNKYVSPTEGVFEFEAGDISVGKQVHKALRCWLMRVDDLAGQQVVKSFLAQQPQGRALCVTLDLEMPGQKGLGVGGRVQHLAGPFDANGVLQFGDRPADAPILHFGGPLQIDFYGEQQLVIDREKQVTLAAGTPGVGAGSTVLIAHEDLIPRSARPRLAIEFPAARQGDPPVMAEYELKDRCCTYNFIGNLRPPPNVSAGRCSATIRFDAWDGAQVAPSSRSIDVVAPRSRVVFDAVSPRLKGALIHPAMRGTMTGIAFSPDGRQIIAGDYPGGIVQLWDVASGREGIRIESGNEFRGSDRYLFLSPDWSTIYIARSGRTKPTKVEKEGKTFLNWAFEGSIRAWNLATGELIGEYRQSPPRAIVWMDMSRDGRTLMVGEQLPGIWEEAAPRAASLFDVATKQFRPLEGKLSALGTFSADGKMLAIANEEQNESTEIRLFDVATGKVRNSLPIRDQFTNIGYTGFSPANDIFVSTHRVLANRGDWTNWRSHLTFWNALDGTELMTFKPDEANGAFRSLVYAPDGQRLAVADLKGALYLFDLAQRKLAQAVMLSDDPDVVTSDPAFSRDGNWIAVTTQVFPQALRRTLDPNPDDIAQPRIHIVQAATGIVRETLVAPQAFVVSMCFSPDGKTLATGGSGRVMLWDMTALPGGADIGGRK